MDNELFTVLVVDDEKPIRDLIAMVLERQGYRVLLAEHSDEAFLKIDQFPGTIHLLLTDLKMDPFMDGCELAKCVRLLRPHIHVLYISGLADNTMVHQEVAAGRASFIQKPFSAHDILDYVQLISSNVKVSHKA